MPRNASGNYTLPTGNPVEAGTLIEATWANTTLSDLGNEVTKSLSRTGEGGMLAPFRLADGLLATPGIAWLNEPSSGFYRAGAGEMWGVVQGTQVLQYTANGVLVPTGRTFTAQGNATVGGTLAVTGAITATGGVSGNVTGNLTGNVTGNVSGNAGTVTNGVYTTGAYADPAWITSLSGSKVSGGISGNAATATTATNVAGGTASVTTLSASGAVTLSGGTANGVAFLNASKQVTTGSALTFDGADLSFQSAIKLLNNDGSGNKAVLSSFAYGGSGATGTLTLSSTYGNANQQRIRIGVGGAAATSFEIDSAEQMRLTSTGLGIGTTNTTNGRLNVQAGTASTGNSGFFTNIDGTNNPYVQIQHSSLGTKLFASSSAGGTASNLTLSTPGGDLVLNASGNLGLGVTPSAWDRPAFQTTQQASFFGLANTANVVQNAYFNAGWKYQTTGAVAFSQVTQGGFNWFTAPSGTAGTAISFTQAMTLDGSGNLGVGITSPTARVHAYSTTAMKQLTVDGIGAIKTGINFASGGTTYGQIYFDNNAPYDMSVLQQYSTGSLILGTNNTERARITSAGDLIQTANTTAPTLTTNGTVGIQRVSDTQLKLLMRGSDGVTRSVTLTLA